MHENYSLSKKEKDQIKKIVACFDKNRSVLEERFNQTFLSLAYENRLLSILGDYGN
jgi:hypothetical protein